MNKRLIERVLDQIITDVKCYDLTAIEELLLHIPEENLRFYLPEGNNIEGE